MKGEVAGTNEMMANESQGRGNPIVLLADHITDIGLEPVGVSEEYRYASLPLCVIDAVFSIGVQYKSTQNTVARFCAKTGWPQFAPSREGRGTGSHSISDLLALYGGLSDEAATSALFGNRQRTSTTSGILKGEAVRLFAEALRQSAIETFADFIPDRLEFAEAKILSLPGQRSRISFDYFRMLAGDDDRVKPDRMIERFVACVPEVEKGSLQTAELVRLVARELNRRGQHWTPLSLDYAIWQYQREPGTSKRVARCRSNNRG